MRCGAPQPRRVLRGAMIAIGFGVFAALVIAFTSIEGGAAQREVQSSNGSWQTEEEDQSDYRPNLPSEISVMLTRDAAVP